MLNFHRTTSLAIPNLVDLKLFHSLHLHCSTKNVFIVATACVWDELLIVIMD